jgi:uncharacterized delta-60 repeat protein
MVAVVWTRVVVVAPLALAVGPIPPPPFEATRFPQPDGTSFVVGKTTLDSRERSEAFAIWKRNPDGTPDTGFNREGLAVVPIWGYVEEAKGLAVQPDGGVVVAGNAWDPICSYICEDRVAIVRLNPDGSLDRTFHGDGRVAIVTTYVGLGLYGKTMIATPGNELSFQFADVVVLPDGAIQIQNGKYPTGKSVYAQVAPDGTPQDGVDSIDGRIGARDAPLVQAQGLWYAAPAESEAGWGINVAQQGEVIFATWFTYDVTGRAWWLSMTATRTGEGIYQGTIEETRGPALNAQPFDSTQVTRTAIGDGTLTFTNRDSATFAYTVNGVPQSKAITRQIFGPLPGCSFGTLRDPALATNYQDLWWAAPAESESGWGLNLAHQGDTIFATWFTYDLDHKPLWLSGTARKTDAGNYVGTLDRTTGSPFNAVPWDKSAITHTPVGTFTLTFADGNSGTFQYQLTSVAVEQTKSITRQVFRAPGTTCR